MNTTYSAILPTDRPKSPETDERIVVMLDQLEMLGKCSVIYEISRIEMVLSNVFEDNRLAS